MDIITILYSLSGMVLGAAFLPQIITLAKDRSGAVSVNFPTWFMFTACSLISLTYALTHNGDNHFILCSSIGAIGNCSVLMLAAFRRMQTATIHIKK